MGINNATLNTSFVPRDNYSFTNYWWMECSRVLTAYSLSDPLFSWLAFTINFTNKISSPMPLHASSRHWDVTTRNIIIYLGSASDWKIVNIGFNTKKTFISTDTGHFCHIEMVAGHKWQWELLGGHTTYNIAAPAVGYHPSIKLLKYIIGTLLRISGNTNPSDSGGHRLDNVIIKCLLQG